MSTIMPQGELLRNAVKWISARREETGASLADAMEQAAMRFNLGPKDCEFLAKFFKENETGEQG